MRGFNLVIFDSENKAGDNGEYLYRMVREKYPEIGLVFLLNPQSPDYDRLRKDGFDVRPFSSAARVFSNATFILFSKDLGGSHCAQVLLPKYRSKTIFLGHGVTSVLSRDSSYISECIGKLAQYMCCTSDEEASVIKKYSNGKLLPISCGFPRHDFLLRKLEEHKKKNLPKSIFITFHYRKSLGGQYLCDINKLLNSDGIRKLHERGVKINFLPHARFIGQISKFKVPEYVNVPLDVPFQDVLVESDLLITDISSNNFEMAYMDKPTIMFVPGERDVKNDMSHYRLDNYKLFPHIFRCKTQEDVFKKTDELLHRNEPFDFSSKLFKHKDTDNSRRLVEWMK